MTKLLHCNHCGKLFTIVDSSKNEFITDFGDKIKKYDDIHKINCINCGNYSNFDLIECENWVLDRVFSIKGE